MPFRGRTEDTSRDRAVPGRVAGIPPKSRPVSIGMSSHESQLPPAARCAHLRALAIPLCEFRLVGRLLGAAPQPVFGRACSKNGSTEVGLQAVSGESGPRSACGEKFPAGAEARHIPGLFAAVRAEAVTYQPCPDTRQADLGFCVIPPGLKRLRKSSEFRTKSAKSIPQGLKPTLILLRLRPG